MSLACSALERRFDRESSELKGFKGLNLMNQELWSWRHQSDPLSCITVAYLCGVPPCGYYWQLLMACATLRHMNWGFILCKWDCFNEIGAFCCSRGWWWQASHYSITRRWVLNIPVLSRSAIIKLTPLRVKPALDSVLLLIMMHCQKKRISDSSLTWRLCKAEPFAREGQMGRLCWRRRVLTLCSKILRSVRLIQTLAWSDS